MFSMKMKVFSFCLTAVLMLLAGCATLSDSGQHYRETVQNIRQGQTDFAVIHLQAIVKEYPSSPYAPQATFALGEYYYDIGDYYNAIKTFSDYIHAYPKDKGVVFSKLIIYKIITSFEQEKTTGEAEDALVKMIRKELFAQPLFLIFYDKKMPRSYKSLFNYSYIVYDYVDKIKVFRNDKIFLELSP